MLQNLNYYTFETKKVRILWRNKVQPLGSFYSASDALQIIRQQIDAGFKASDYSINAGGVIINATDYI